MAKKTAVNMVKVNPIREQNEGEKVMTLATNKLPEKTVAGQIPQAIADGILAGHIAHQIEDVVIKAKSSPTKKDEKRPFDAFYAVTADGMMILSGGKLECQTDTKDLPKDATEAQVKELRRKGGLDYFNYGRLLDVRQAERGLLEDSIIGHEKAIDKQVKQLTDGQVFDDAETARAHVIRQWKKVNRLPEDYTYPTAPTA